MLLSSLFRPCRPRHQSPTNTVPCLEALEDRLAPAGFGIGGGIGFSFGIGGGIGGEGGVGGGEVRLLLPLAQEVRYALYEARQLLQRIVDSDARIFRSLATAQLQADLGNASYLNALLSASFDTSFTFNPAPNVYSSAMYVPPPA